MTRGLRLLYPLLFAALPILNMTANNAPGAYTLTEFLVALAVVMAGIGAVYVLLLAIFRRRWTAEQIAVVVMAVVVWFWGYRLAFRWAARVVDPPLTHVAMIAGGLALTAALVPWLFRRAGVLDRMTTFLGLTGGMLAAWSTAGVVSDQVRNYRALRNNPTVRALARPMPLTVRHAAAGPRPDIYLILLDEYGDGATLRDYYGFDNRPFEDSLRALGFTIPANVRSNYTYTTFSLPSLLNFTLLDGLSDIDTHVPNALLRSPRAAAFLEAQGYRYVFVPSQWWIPTQHQPAADVEVRVWPRVGFDRGLTTANLWRELRRATPLVFTSVGGLRHDADYVLRTFRVLKELPPSDQPTFVFAHVLSPHWPLIMDPTCRPDPRRVGAAVPRRGRQAAYIDQVRCVNHLVLDLVPALLARSRVPPIILLQSDHGSKWAHHFDSASTAAALSPEQARERFSAFAAYYLPAGGGAAFRDSVTLVNVFPKIFNYYFGANISLQPDRYFTTVAGQDALWPVDGRLIDGIAHDTPRPRVTVQGGASGLVE